MNSEKITKQHLEDSEKIREQGGRFIGSNFGGERMYGAAMLGIAAFIEHLALTRKNKEVEYSVDGEFINKEPTAVIGKVIKFVWNGTREDTEFLSDPDNLFERVSCELEEKHKILSLLGFKSFADAKGWLIVNGYIAGENFKDIVVRLRQAAGVGQTLYRKD